MSKYLGEKKNPKQPMVVKIIRSEGLGALSWMVKEDRPLEVTKSSSLMAQRGKRHAQDHPAIHAASWDPIQDYSELLNNVVVNSGITYSWPRVSSVPPYLRIQPTMDPVVLCYSLPKEIHL